MKKIVIITGANRGLGKAFVDQMLKGEDTLVISISRSLSEDHESVDASKLILIKTDLSKPFSQDLSNVLDKFLIPETTLYFINNAGIILPIGKVGAFKESEIEHSVLVNIQYPINLINFILNRYSANKIVSVNISSGAAVNPVASWSMYSAAKAFMQQFFNVLAEENKENKNLEFFQFNPGVMDTGMQKDIRSKEFPRQDYFKQLKDENKLIMPEDAAAKILKEINYQA
jgi:benzil reductase ((S)-benzoin forming)